MDDAAVAAAPGLRERKRRCTREAIAAAALDLFDRQGFRATTLAQIADAADVSPRTVSGYFPSKEAIAFPDADRDLERLSARLLSRSDGETTTEALRAWISSWLLESEGREHELAVRRRVIRADDHLRDYERTLFARAQAPIAEAIARDLGRSPGDLEARMAAAATLTILELLGDDYPPGEPAVLEPLDSVLRFVNGGIAALRERTA